MVSYGWLTYFARLDNRWSSSRARSHRLSLTIPPFTFLSAESLGAVAWATRGHKGPNPELPGVTVCPFRRS